MKTKIKRHSRSVLSVVLALCMLLSCMTAGMIMTDAARVNDEAVSFNTSDWLCVKCQSDNWKEHWVSPNGTFDLDLTAYAAGDDVPFNLICSNNNINYYLIENSGSSYRPQIYTTQNANQNFNGNKGTTSTLAGSFHVTSPCTITVKLSWNGENSANVKVTNVTTTTYNVTASAGAGGTLTASHSKATAGTTITATATPNRGYQLSSMTESNGRPVTRSGNKGTYTMPSADSTVYAAFSPLTERTLTLNSSAGGTLTARVYNTDYTAAADGSASATAYKGESVTFTAAPVSGYVLQSLDLYYDNIHHDVTSSVSNNTYTWTMLDKNVTATATYIQGYPYTTVYYDNYLTKWAKVYAYSWIETADSVTYTESGAKPGIEMTQVGTSSIYEIRIPYSANNTFIIFTGSGGASNEGAAITGATGNAVPGQNKQYKSTTADASKGTWGDYTERKNVYTVTPGQSVKGNNKLYYDGITATLYDYYVDGEYNNGSSNWLKGIGDREYSKSNGSQFDWNPYGNLNTALSQYANDEDVTYPLYFGTLDTINGGNHWGTGGDPTNYTHWNFKVNNSNGLSATGKFNAAVQGLASSSELNSNIAYSSGDEMILFNEDWLSQENSKGKPLATILHSTGFPVRKVTKSGAMNYIVFDMNRKWDGTNIWAWMWEAGESGKWIKFTYDSSSGFYIAPAADYDYMKIFSLTSDPSDVNAYGTPSIKYGDNAVTSDITITKANYAKLQLSAYNSASFITTDTNSPARIIPDYTYYEYDSTGGKDNAFIQNIDSTDKTATIEYSNTTSVKDKDGHAGFFPFDYTLNSGDLTKDNHNLAHDMGFGMKLEIPFTINRYGTVDGEEDGFAQTFNFSGDDDLWVYIDGKLVLDLGGAHARTTGSINFKTLEATADWAETVSDSTAQSRSASFSSVVHNQTEADADTLHTMTLYYMERGMSESNLKFNFSFHAISNLLTTEKKVRTNNINSGFYETNENIPETAIRNKSDVQNDKGYITKFEKSYQNEVFAFDHKVSSSSDGTYAYPAQNFTYSKNVVDPSVSGESTSAVPQTYTAGDGLTYTLTNDDKAIFKDKFTAGHYIQLNETMARTNKYSYDPKLTVYDDTDSTGKTRQTVDGNNPYTFRFQKVNSTGSSLDVVNLRARYENEMKQHTLTVTKEIGDAAYNNEEFEFQILFNTKYTKDGDDEFVAYPLYCVSDASSMTKIGKDGKFTVKANETVTFTGIPEGIEFKIIETGCPNTFAYGSITASGATATPVSGQNAAKMTMGEDDVDVSVNNVDNNVRARVMVQYADKASSYYTAGQSGVSLDTYKYNSGTPNMTTTVGAQPSFSNNSVDPGNITYTSTQMTGTAVKNSSSEFQVTMNGGEGDYLFIGWFNGTGTAATRYDTSDPDNYDASADKSTDRLFVARFIIKPTYRIDYNIPTRLWGDRVFKITGTIGHSDIGPKKIGFVQSGEQTDTQYYITNDFVQSNIPNEKIFLKTISWEEIGSLNAQTETKYDEEKTVTFNTSDSGITNVENVTETGPVTYSLYRVVSPTVTNTKCSVEMHNDCTNDSAGTNASTMYTDLEYGSSVANNSITATNIPSDRTFYRWRIETLNSLGESDSTADGKLVTYDYSKEFNYVVYDNYKVVAETLLKQDGLEYNPYTAGNGNTYPAPENTSTALVLGLTRSHWNDTKDGIVYEPGDDESENRTAANHDYDRMFVDLALSYSDGHETLLNKQENLKVGFVIQYKSGDNWVDFQFAEFDSTKLDNKNRIEYYYGFNNAAVNRNAMLRAVPYIGSRENRHLNGAVEFNFKSTFFSGGAVL